jgi:hypothetical protein
MIPRIPRIYHSRKLLFQNPVHRNNLVVVILDQPWIDFDMRPWGV